MGIATGEAEQRGDDYFGPALNRAARVMAVGHGGQVLLSISTASLVTGIDLLDLGKHQLRDLSGVKHLLQVRAEGLRVEFHRLRTVDAVPGNLPRQTTSFVGRDVEVDELVGLVRKHELVTLTGVGGVGKTRLAVQVAAELVPDFVERRPQRDPCPRQPRSGSLPRTMGPGQCPPNQTRSGPSTRFVSDLPTSDNTDSPSLKRPSHATPLGSKRCTVTSTRP